MRRFAILLAVLILGILLTLGITYRHHFFKAKAHPEVSKEEEAKDMQEVNKLLEEEKAADALKIVNRYAWKIEQKAPNAQEWLLLYVKTNRDLGNAGDLVLLYKYYPDAFKDDEKAILLVETGNILNRNSKDFETLREQWKGKETNKEAWFILDVDKLLLDGKRKEALDLLKSQTFEGKLDTARLTRLALLTVSENPKQAWDYLSQAYVKDPENPDIRSYRAKILEAFGKNTLALTEYIAAAQTAPKNLYLRDQLAQFFIRHNNFVEALQVLQQALLPPSLDFIWVETYFWNRVAIPLKFDWKKIPPPEGNLLPYLNYLINLAPNKFWDAKEFDKVENSSLFLKSEQSTFWLRLLDALQNGREQEAANLLKYNVFRTISWAPNLERALKRILAYRLNGTFNYDPLAKVNNPSEIEFESPNSEQMNALFTELEVYAKPPKEGKEPVGINPEFKALMKGPLAFVAVFLSQGWFEAAIQLNKEEKLPSDIPAWVPFIYTQALKVTQNDETALKFATEQTPAPFLNLGISQLLIAQNKIDESIPYLTDLIKSEDGIGDQAALILSLIYAQKKDYAKAKEILLSHPNMAESITGKETLARIALFEGNTEEAINIYTSIQGQSIEAKSFLARKAFEEKNYKKAQELTEDLLRENPINNVLQENLKQIMDIQKQNP